MLWRGMDKLQDAMDVKLMKRSLKWGIAVMFIGGIAIFANLKKIWLIMFVVELINVALFLVRSSAPSPVPRRCSACAARSVDSG